MISALIGLPGEGKTLTASMRIREDLDHGRTVFSNIHLNEERPNYHYFPTRDWKVVLKLQDGIIYMDEGQFVLDARQWQDLPVEFRQLLQKGRHEGLDFVVLTQHIMQIDVAYRRLIYDAKKVTRVFSYRKWSIGLFLLWNANLLGDSDISTEGFPEFVLAQKEDYDYYNSFALRSRHILMPDVECEECGVIHRVNQQLLD